MKWLLDTNVISETARPSPSHAVLRFLAGLGRRDAVVSVITLAELRFGIQAISPSRRRERLETWVSQDVMITFAERTLPATFEILVDWIALTRRLKSRGRPHSPADMLIAATARVHGLTVVTRNGKDFAGTGVTVFDPWRGETHRMESP